MSEAKFKYLFSPIKIGTMTMKNRILMSPMGLEREDVKGGTYYDMEVERMKAFYTARAAGGVGAVTNGGAAIDIRAHAEPGLWCVFDDRMTPQIKEVADVVHETAPDCKFGVQLLHGGCQARVPNQEAPSRVAALAVVPTVPGYPEVMTEDRIKFIQEQWARAALRCKEAGCDFVEVHGSHGYLMTEFYSPVFNKRTDDYGGSFENRVKMYIETLRKIREYVGKDFPVGCRYNGDDYYPGGWTLEDAWRLGQMLEEAGADYLSISFGIYGSTGYPGGKEGWGMTSPPMYDAQGQYVYLAEEVKKHVHIPVFGGGRIKDPYMADQLIRDGKVDGVFMGRALLADPDLPNEWREGRLDEVVPCLGCCIGCIERALRGYYITCVMNPRCEREGALKDVKGECAANPKRVLVVGGGIAGMEAARLAAFRGHRVSLYESRAWLGGQAMLASKMPGRAEVAEAITYYERELSRLHVPIHLNTTVDETLLDEVKPDVVVAATGSLVQIPYITGLLDSGVEIILADDLIEKDMPTGDNVLVVGGDHAGLQIAHHLALRGKKLWVIEESGHFAERMGGNDRWPLRTRLDLLNVPQWKGVSLARCNITIDGVKIVHKKGEETLPKIDTVVLTGPRQKNTQVAELAKSKGIKTYVVGDAHMLYEDPLAGTMLGAIQEANFAAREIV